MNDNRAPAFQFYAKDWLDWKVLRMSDAAQGVYIRLLAHMWKDSPDQCSLPDNDKEIAKVIGKNPRTWSKLRAEIQKVGDPLLLAEEGRLISKRLRKEKQEMDLYREGRRKAGIAGAEKRWHSHAPANAEAMTKNSPSSSSSSSVKNTSSSQPSAGVKGASSNRNTYPPEFEVVWRSYPRGVGKAAGYLSCSKLVASGVSWEDLQLAAYHYSADCSRNEVEERYIKHAQGFFGKTGRWEEFINGPPEEEAKPDPRRRPVAEVMEANRLDLIEDQRKLEEAAKAKDGDA